MKRKSHIPFSGTTVRLLCLYLLLGGIGQGLTACSSSSPADDTEEELPLQLSAGGEIFAQPETRAGNLPEEAFTATVYRSTEQGEYADLTGEWEGSREAAVGTDGKMVWSGMPPFPSYPRYGDWIYVVAVSPSPASFSAGTVSYTLTGVQDLLYAPEMKGNRWDGYRFYGNTAGMGLGDRPLVFSHLLTRIQFKAKKKIADGVAVKVTKVTVTGVQNSVSLPLATDSGGKASPTFSGNADLSWTAPDGGVEVTDAVSPIDLGTLLLPPLDSGTYALTVETSVGTYSNVSIGFGSTSGPSPFQAGVSHIVTLEVSDYELEVGSVTVSAWTLVPVDGDLIL